MLVWVLPFLLYVCTFKGNHVGNLYNAPGLSCLASGFIGCLKSRRKLLKGGSMPRRDRTL